MKRENDDSLSQDMEENDQYDQDDQSADKLDQDSNEINNINNQTNSNQENGPTNPPKRQRRNDDEEVRLLIPSKVHLLFHYILFIMLSFSNPPLKISS